MIIFLFVDCPSFCPLSNVLIVAQRLGNRYQTDFIFADAFVYLLTIDFTSYNIELSFIEYIFNFILEVTPIGIRDEQKEKRREEILKASLDLFISKGYTATKIKDIAEAVGMSVGLMFHYFDSKETLYEALIKYGISGPMNTMALANREPIAFFEVAAQQIFKYIEEEPFVAKMFVLMGQASYNNDSPASVKKLLEGFDIYTPTSHLIAKGQADGTIRDGDPMALSLAYWCAIHGIAVMYATNPGQPLPDSEWIVDIIRRK